MKRFLALLLNVIVAAALPGAPATSKNAAAQKAYEQGLDLIKNGEGVKPVEKALAQFQQAVALDPQFAAAHAQISLAYSALGDDYNYWSPARTATQSLQAAEKAIALNARLPEAHAAMAWAQAAVRWDWVGAEQSYRKAISLQPATSDAFVSYAFFLASLGRVAEADAQFRKAQALGVAPLLAHSYAIARISDRKELTQLVAAKQQELGKQSPTAYWLWNQAFGSCKARDWANGERYLLQQIPLMDSDVVDEVALLGHVYGRTGRKADALKRLAQLDEIEKSGLYVSPVLRAWIHLGVDDKDRAFAELDQAVAQRAYRLGLAMKWLDFVYDPIRDDPRYAALMKKMKL